MCALSVLGICHHHREEYAPLPSPPTVPCVLCCNMTHPVMVKSIQVSKFSGVEVLLPEYAGVLILQSTS